MADQAQLVKAFDTLRKVAATASKNEKEKILKEGKSHYLARLLNLAYDKFKTYRIQQIEQPAQYNSVQPDTLAEFEELCARLAQHEVGRDYSKLIIKAFLAKNTKEGAEIFTNVLLRDLRGGFDEKTINKAFPGLIPTFAVQLANKADDLSKLKYPLLVEEKLDGVRTIAAYDGNVVKFFSREGREFDECGVIAEQIKQLAPGLPFVLDGEFIATKFNPQNKTCLKYQNGNWPFNYGLSLVKSQDKTAAEIAEHLGYIVWDLLDYDYFMSGGVKGICGTLQSRKLHLSSLFNRHQLVFKNLDMVANCVCQTQQEVMQIFREMRLHDKEGIMIKNLDAFYDFKRSNAVLKMKEFFTMDLRIVGAEEGTGKYLGKLGALVMEDDEGKISTKVGSGFSDDDRTVLWIDWLNGSLKGQIGEVSAQEVTEDGSLRFPTWIGLRYDKTTTNTEIN